MTPRPEADDEERLFLRQRRKTGIGTSSKPPLASLWT